MKEWTGVVKMQTAVRYGLKIKCRGEKPTAKEILDFLNDDTNDTEQIGEVEYLSVEEVIPQEEKTGEEEFWEE